MSKALLVMGALVDHSQPSQWLTLLVFCNEQEYQEHRINKLNNASKSWSNCSRFNSNGVCPSGGSY